MLTAGAVLSFLCVAGLVAWVLARSEDAPSPPRATDGSELFQVIPMEIPWPSGIIMEKVLDSEGRVHRIGRLLHSAISIRPQWASVHVLEGVLNTAQCRGIVVAAEEHVAEHGWPTQRHVDYAIRPTFHLPMQTLFGNATKPLRKALRRLKRLAFASIAEQFAIARPELLYLSDMFLTKYDATVPNRNLLAGHQDNSLFSFVIALNRGNSEQGQGHGQGHGQGERDEAEFEGGGTFFFEQQQGWRPPRGSMLYFNGKHFHGGSPITSGKRYILAGFVDYDKNRTEQSFRDLYSPEHDGYAFQAGFRTDDEIVAVQECFPAQEETGVVGGFGDNAMSVGRRTVDGIPELSDEQWVSLVQSCEKLRPNDSTVLVARRRSLLRSTDVLGDN